MKKIVLHVFSDVINAAREKLVLSFKKDLTWTMLGGLKNKPANETECERKQEGNI